MILGLLLRLTTAINSYSIVTVVAMEIWRCRDVIVVVKVSRLMPKCSGTGASHTPWLRAWLVLSTSNTTPHHYHPEPKENISNIRRLQHIIGVPYRYLSASDYCYRNIVRSTWIGNPVTSDITTKLL
jgi:hypothetical protein